MLTEEQQIATNVLLKAARLLQSDMFGWTQKSDARDSFGRECAATSKQASRWSADGALQAAITTEARGEFGERMIALENARNHLARAILRSGYRPIGNATSHPVLIYRYNDSPNRTLQEVVNRMHAAADRTHLTWE